MGSKQHISSLPQVIHDELLGDMPGEPMLNGRWDRVVEDAILVEFAFRTKARMEILANFFHPFHRNIIGKKAVQSSMEGIQGDPAFRLKIGNLSEGMDARICPSRGDQTYIFSCDHPDLLLKHALDGRETGLYLPPAVGGSVIFDGEFDVPHFQGERCPLQ